MVSVKTVIHPVCNVQTISIFAQNVKLEWELMIIISVKSVYRHVYNVHRISVYARNVTMG